MPLPAINKNGLDVSQVFSTYIAFGGDENRTAIALDLDLITVHNLAQVENWPAKVKQWHELKDGDPKELQIQINRAVNFVQSNRLRSILDRVTTELHALDGQALIAALTVNTKNGPEFKTRALTDLVKAAETVQLMTQRALGDTVQERPEVDQNSKGSSIMLAVANAMQAADQVGIDSVEVVRKQLALETPTKPAALPDANR